MRAKRTAQTSLFDPETVDHPVAEELEWASAWLDAHPELLDEMAADLGAETGASRGRHGLTCETILRCAVLKHLRQETCRGLEFTLRDSRSAQRFARVDVARLPRKSALQATMGAVRATTWERINRRLLSVARDTGVETGERVRIDSTVTATHILEPADSRLLYDGVRVLTRLLDAARERLGSADRLRTTSRPCHCVVDATLGSPTFRRHWHLASGCTCPATLAVPRPTPQCPLAPPEFPFFRPFARQPTGCERNITNFPYVRRPFRRRSGIIRRIGEKCGLVPRVGSRRRWRSLPRHRNHREAGRGRCPLRPGRRR